MLRAARPVLLCAVVLVITVAGRGAAQAAGRQVVVPAGMSVSATLSPGIRVGDMVYASGQLGTKPGSREAPDSTIQGQTRQALENVKAVVEAAGTSMANVAKCTVFIVDVKDFAGMNQAYARFFPKEPPARSTVVVAALVRADAKVEIECTAAIPR